MLLLSVLLACDLIEDLKSDSSPPEWEIDTGPDAPPSGSAYSFMPDSAASTAVNWNCDFLINLEGIGQTGLEDYGVIAIHAQLTAALYESVGTEGWEMAPSWEDAGLEVVDGEVLYGGMYFPMGRGAFPGYLTAAVSYGPVDMNLCRGYLWIDAS